MGFTPDGLPCIGFLRPGLIIAAGFNGYGGTYTTAAGHAAAHMARTGTAPDWVPDDVFSPHRFATAEPVFMSEKDSLWRIAASLCNQLDLVNARMSEALSIQPRTQRLSPNLSVDGADAARMRSASLMMTPEEIKAFPLFATARPRRSKSGFPKRPGGANRKALIRRRAGQCMDHILVS